MQLGEAHQSGDRHVDGGANDACRGGLDRKTGWTLAEQARDLSPDGMQRLLRWADWDIDAVRDEVRDYVIEHLGDPQGVLIIDDNGFLKKGVNPAGVARQYSGTAGRVGGCQIGVFLAYRSSRGHALIDRQLYWPAAWTDDRDRCRAAGVPDEVGFATKVETARQMLARAFVAGCLAAWVAMDEAFGQSKSLRVWLEGTRPAAGGGDPLPRTGRRRTRAAWWRARG